MDHVQLQDTDRGIAMVVFVDELGPKQLGQIRTLIESGFPHWVGWCIPGISQVLREWQRTR